MTIGQIEQALIVALIDARAMLEHYTSGRPNNWDGSTKAQALSVIRDADAALALAKEAKLGDSQ